MMPQPNNHADAAPDAPPLRVAILDRLVPHYREALYDRLMRSARAEYTIVAAQRGGERMRTIDPKPHWRWIDAPTHRIPGLGNASVWQPGLIRAALSRRFDVLLMMANPRDPAMVLAAILGRRTGKRICMWTHGYRAGRSRSNYAVRRAWHRLAHALLFYSRAGRDRAVSLGDDPQRCHVIYNSLDYDRQKALRESIGEQRRAAVREELFGSADARYIICISRLLPEKRIDLMIGAMSALQERGATHRLLIVGDGPMRSDLERQIQQLGLTGIVRLYGPCYDEPRVAELLCAADLCVAPARVGLTAIHAMAYGVPVVTHDDPADQGPEVEAIVPGETGDVYRNRHREDLVEKALAWVSPDARREGVAAQCISVIERFYTPQVQAAAIERAVLGEPSPAE